METLPRRQWNLNPPKINSKNFSPIFFPFFFFFLQVSYIKTPKQVDEFIEIQSSTGTWYQRWLVRITTTLKQVKRRKKLCTVLQCLFASGHCTLKSWLSPQKICFLQRAVVWLHILCRCVLLPDVCPAASQALKCPCEHHCHPAVQSSQDQPQPLGSPPEQINIESLSPSLQEITTCTGGRKCLLFDPAETKFLRVLYCLLG